MQDNLSTNKNKKNDQEMPKRFMDCKNTICDTLCKVSIAAALVVITFYCTKTYYENKIPNIINQIVDESLSARLASNHNIDQSQHRMHEFDHMLNSILKIINHNDYEYKRLYPTTSNGLITKEHEYVITLEIPEFRKEDISVNLVDNSVVIKGYHNMVTKGNNNRHDEVKRAFQQTICLDGYSDIDKNKINTSVADGIVTITLPRVAQNEQRLNESESDHLQPN